MTPSDDPARQGTILIANPSGDLYGSDRMMLEAARGLVRDGWRTVVTCASDGPLVARLREAGAEVVVLSAPVVRKSMLSPRGMAALLRDIVTRLPRMRRLVREVDPDVVLVNTVTVPFWTLAARTCGTPAVVYVHEAEAGLSGPARALLTAPLRLATGVVFNSETSRRVAGWESADRQLRADVVPNGVVGPAQARPARLEITGPLRVVYVGRLSPRKGTDLVLRAAARLRDAGVETDVEIVGSVFPGYEWYETELRELVDQLDLAAQVRFTGFRETVWRELADADVAVVPSRLDESFGNVVIEALLSERPVVVADHTGLAEAASGFSAAVLVPSDDEEALARGLLQVRDGWTHYRAGARRDAARARREYGTDRFHARLLRALRRHTAPAPSAAPGDRQWTPALD
ncbi:glycosyltransferase [Microbacterium sp. BK668]|uniref:glycosyltransferase n=1 Tax=Microbacterium sp. BK668 TaxID=2512118 RepID=UPI001060436F|nr:glycosyltransferase [Microbacterium sp. BK668]TDN90826.1 glycosyltransferase involved in cell wall biosynthesis [Microbacterium sp. BK668]